MSEGAQHQARHLSVWGYLGIVAGYIVVLIVATTFTLDRTLSTPGYTETGGVGRELVVRMAFPLAFVCVVVTLLRWWRPVLATTDPSGAGCGSCPSRSSSRPSA